MTIFFNKPYVKLQTHTHLQTFPRTNITQKKIDFITKRDKTDRLYIVEINGQSGGPIRTLQSFKQNPQQSMHAHTNVYTAEQIIQLKKKQMVRGHNFKTPTKTARKTRQHKKKTRLNFKFTLCIYILN